MPPCCVTAAAAAICWPDIGAPPAAWAWTLCQAPGNCMPILMIKVTWNPIVHKRVMAASTGSFAHPLRRPFIYLFLWVGHRWRAEKNEKEAQWFTTGPNDLPWLIAELSISGVALHALDKLRLHLRRVATGVPVAHALIVAVWVLSTSRSQTARHQLRPPGRHIIRNKTNHHD